jgi:hypothetical protein
MRKTAGHIFTIKRTLLALLIISFTGIVNETLAQQMPPRPVIVTANPSQPLAFGAFALSLTGGTVTVHTDGSRSSTGNIFLIGMGYLYSSAMFYIRTDPGTVISLLNPAPSILTGSGGGSMTLTIDSTDPITPFVTTVPITELTTVLVGGTLTVGSLASNPPGSYTGTFNIIFVQE